MGLLNVKLPAIKKLSLQGAIFRTQEPEPALIFEGESNFQPLSVTPPKTIEQPLSSEQVIYNSMINNTPFLDDFFDRLDLVSLFTEERITVE